MSEPPNVQYPAPDRALKCEVCGAKPARTYYCRSHDVVLCGGCAWARHSDCGTWRLIEEAPEMDADEEVTKSRRRTSERMRSFAAGREGQEGGARLAARRVRCVNAIVLAIVAGLVAFMVVCAIGCCSSVPAVVRDRAPAARRAAEVYVERTEPRDDLTDEERAETRELGEALIRYLREMEAATR